MSLLFAVPLDRKIYVDLYPKKPVRDCEKYGFEKKRIIVKSMISVIAPTFENNEFHPERNDKLKVTVLNKVK